SDFPGSSSDPVASSGTESATEPVSEPETDPFEDSEPLPDNLEIPSCLKTADGSILGTIVLPKAAAEDPVLNTAAQELRYHLKLVLGADFPIVSRPGEGYGSIILATPDTLPAVRQMFADDLAWLADLGTKETGRWGSDGFAVRQAGDSIYVIGNTSKGAMNGVYDLLEDNFEILWTRADEQKGLIYDKLEEASIQKCDYREKSPFEIRGILFGEERTNALLIARNKGNTLYTSVPDLGLNSFECGHSIMSLLLSSPAYDPEETEYWETDSEGNCLGQAGSLQVNPWSDKAAEVIAATIIARMQADPPERHIFIGIEDRPHGRVVPEDTLPFEYAPGEFVYPEDRNYDSTLHISMINKIARLVKAAIPDGRIGAFAYSYVIAPPACEIEDNVRICYAASGEDFTASILDPSIRDRVQDPVVIYHCEDLPTWLEKANSVVFWHYYTCNAFGTEFGWPIWYRIQEDFQGYQKMGVEGLATDGTIPDLDMRSSWLDYNSAKGMLSNYWDMNHLLCWLYQKLLWNPYEDIPSLISYFCDKVYGEASPYMQEYYHLMEQGFKGATETRKKQTAINLRTAEFYQFFVRKQGIGHPILDALEAAYQAASGPIKETIQYMLETVRTNLNSFRSF
ncbi:MAG: DUF4838 domain-containing protein, partial [Candidatus Methanomethylophilaceae archaeon]|nr:DUF4838 domain-containing protein [Candidatus Methanomethylophilaceae archaeon]